MNRVDQRLYHYEYRRPRNANRTYNSSNVFDSLNMFVGVERPSQLHRSGMYSLPQHHDSVSLNRSEVANSRYRMDDSLRDRNNYSTIVQPEQRQPMMLSDKDYLYLRMLEEKRKVPGQATGRESRVSNNPEGGEGGKRDSLSRQMEEFEASRR